MTLRSLSEVPAPPTRHPLGHSPALRKKPLELLVRRAREHGDLVRVRLGSTVALFIAAPELLVDHPYDYDKNRSLTLWTAFSGG